MFVSLSRFAEFVEGGSHLDDDMILAYESNHLTPTRLDDEELFLTTDSEEDADWIQREQVLCFST